MPKISEEEAARLRTRWVSGQEAARMLTEQSGREDNPIQPAYVRYLAMVGSKKYQVRYRAGVVHGRDNLYHAGDIQKIRVHTRSTENDRSRTAQAEN